MLSLDTKVDKYTICYHITSGLLTSLYKAKRAGKTVFLKQFNKPSPKSEWYKNYIRYQNHIKKIIEENDLSDFFLFFFDDFEAVVNERKNKKAYFQVFQLIEEGSDLREIIKEYKKQDPFSLNIWSRVFVSSMNRLHKHGIVHSDLKPENLFLVRDPDIKVGYRLQIIDMDFSFLTAKKAPWHGFDGYATTIGYQSPEHLLKKNIPGTASDIFTMGLILYELLCGYHPYSNLDIDEYKENVLNF